MTGQNKRLGKETIMEIMEFSQTHYLIDLGFYRTVVVPQKMLQLQINKNFVPVPLGTIFNSKIDNTKIKVLDIKNVNFLFSKFDL